VARTSCPNFAATRLGTPSPAPSSKILLGGSRVAT